MYIYTVLPIYTLYIHSINDYTFFIKLWVIYISMYICVYVDNPVSMR